MNDLLRFLLLLRGWVMRGREKREKGRKGEIDRDREEKERKNDCVPGV